jgi:hypothetical protein
VGLSCLLFVVELDIKFLSFVLQLDVLPSFRWPSDLKLFVLSRFWVHGEFLLTKFKFVLKVLPLNVFLLFSNICLIGDCEFEFGLWKLLSIWPICDTSGLSLCRSWCLCDSPVCRSAVSFFPIRDSFTVCAPRHISSVHPAQRLPWYRKYDSTMQCSLGLWCNSHSILGHVIVFLELGPLLSKSQKQRRYH